MKWDSFSQAITLSIIALLLLAISVAISLLFRRNRKRSHDVTLHVIQLAALIGLVVIVRQFVLMAREDYDLDGVSLRSINLFFGLLIIFLMLQQLFLLINRLVNNQIRKGGDPTSSKIISRLMKVVIASTFLLMFGEHFGIGVSGLLAFGGIGGIAIGLAGQNILSNFFSGIMLYFDRPFNIGDWIRSPDRNIEGTVVEIGWRITKITTFDNRPLYVPNSLFTSISVENPGRMTNRRIDTVVGLRYDDVGKVSAVVEDIRAMLLNHPDIDQTQDLLVYFNAFASSSVNIMVYCFSKTTHWAQWLSVQQDVYLQIVDIVQKHEAQFAFPSQTLYLEKG